jgi:hypothetical protein
MVRLKLKLYPFHTFLFILFIVLFLCAHNPGQTKAYMTYRTLIAGTAFSLALYGLLYLFFNSRLKAGVMVTFILFSLFQYGVVYEFFDRLYYRGLWPLNNIHRYLVIFYLLVYAFMLWRIKRSRHDFIKINYFLNALIILLLLYNAISICFTHTGRVLAEGPSLTSETIQFHTRQPKPDIYYIVLDGYASSRVLSDYFNFDNTAFTESLRQKGFRICDSAFANDYYTSASLATTLNFEYNNGTADDVLRIRNNRLFRILKQNGYNIWHMKSGYAITSFFSLADKTIWIGGPNEFEKNLFKYTVLRLDDLLGLFAYQRLQSQFDLMGEMAVQEGSPKFCFMHFVAPHPPYIFDRNGQRQSKQKFAENWEPKELYIDQLIYVNKQMQKFLDRLTAVNPGAVVILQSDHGPWIKAKNREDVFEARSQVFYAFYAPRQVKIPSRTSLVNTFPYLLNGLFNCGLDTLPDLYAGKKALMKDPILLKKTESN